LIEACGGRFWLSAKEGASQALCFALPVSRPKTILIIDDDTDTVRLYERYLRLQDYSIVVAFSASEARTKMAEALPDLVLLDVLMPLQDGWDFLRFLRSTPATAEVPVLVCSVLGQPELALALGATAVLPKPVDQGLMLQTIEALLNQPGNPHAPSPAKPGDIASPGPCSMAADK